MCIRDSINAEYGETTPPTMCDQDCALKAITVAGTIYSAQTIVAPSTYLAQDEILATEETLGLTRSIGGGIASLTSVAYMASQSESQELKTAALCSGAAGFVAWTANNVHRAVTRGSTQSYLDTAVTSLLLGLCVAGLYSKK
eukprot:TRINITY_DN28296_c0_g1_i5.p1 TRINITY_DN28296_c0_g1~~TRINITY_DN28296_c0_g1_i5.p1  ORF type:complete len:142 (+),score=38.18 TRINITY_DN28296_c0_g1_i5:180-605(+)